MARTAVITMPTMQEHVDVSNLEDGSFFLYGGDLYEVFDNWNYLRVGTGESCEIEPNHQVIPVKVRIEVAYL